MGEKVGCGAWSRAALAPSRGMQEGFCAQVTAAWRGDRLQGSDCAWLRRPPHLEEGGRPPPWPRGKLSDLVRPPL